MSKRLYPHNRIKYGRSYDLDEICTLFKDKGLHAQTIRKWIKKVELKTIDSGKPALVYGFFLIDFFKKQNDKGKCKTDFDEIYCMKCKDALHIFQNKIQFEQKPNGLCVKGHCRQCKTIMFKTYKIADIQKLKRIFNVVEVLELSDCEKSTCMTHIHDHFNLAQNESSQGELF